MPNSSPRWERFHDALDRTASGQPAPILDDADLQGLLALAGRLREELPHDLPDPAFRADLKQRLLGATPGIVSLPAQRAARQRQFPNVAMVGAIAAVFLAIVAVSSLALFNGSNQPENGTAVGVVRSATGTTTVLATLTAATMTAETAEPTGMGGPLQTPSEMTPEPTAEPTATVEALATQPNTTPSAPSPTATPAAAPTAVVTVTATAEPAVTPTTDRQLAVIPPVDSTTVEAGPVPSADGGAGGTTAPITFTLATAMPEMQPSAPIFVLAPPAEDPEAFVARVGSALGLGTDVNVSDYRGKSDYHVGTNEAGSFHWYPQMGAFSYSGTAQTDTGALTADEVLAASRAWLQDIGYPTDLLASEASVQQLSDVEWLIEIPMASLPQPGYGHPLGVRLITAAAGTVVGATGYWLTPVSRSDVQLISSDDAWNALRSGKGYWFGAGGAFMEGGELRCERIQVSYILTAAAQGLILQPVVAWSGEFIHADGLSSSGVTVFIQAARAREGYAGP
jgi:hypothetical protein